MILLICRLMSDRGDSNARPLRPERSALPTALLSECLCKALQRYAKNRENIVEEQKKSLLEVYFNLKSEKVAV